MRLASVPRIGQAVSCVGAIQSDQRVEQNILSRDRSLCHEVYVVITGFPDPGAGNEKRALLSAKYFKDKSLQ